MNFGVRAQSEKHNFRGSRELHSDSVRSARGKLFQFAPQRLRFDMVFLNNRHYIYDAISDSVKYLNA